jgi:hypothetical protein
MMWPDVHERLGPCSSNLSLKILRPGARFMTRSHFGHEDLKPSERQNFIWLDVT